jgi:hypothetical protein
VPTAFDYIFFPTNPNTYLNQSECHIIEDIVYIPDPFDDYEFPERHEESPIWNLFD